jgi:light-regulated signal transduction histidine kinase (bacteriophytochrome)
LEQANQELEAFSYSVSHDLRSPLRAIDGFSQALLEDCGDILPPEGQRHLKTIREGAQRMGTLIDDLLRFSRLSRQPLNTQPIDMQALAQATWQDLAIPPGRLVDFALKPLPASQGDPALLRQVWTNLLSNAVKYTGGRSPARIEVGHETDPSGRSGYYVRDNGTGFDMKYAHKLFGVFQRLHRADEYEGTGVGLAIVQRIVHRHGGRVWAQSVPDLGATFYFNLSAASPA